MSEITDRIPFALHPVAGWIEMAAVGKRRNFNYDDALFGWSYAIDGGTYGPTWNMILEAIYNERNRG